MPKWISIVLLMLLVSCSTSQQSLPATTVPSTSRSLTPTETSPPPPTEMPTLIPSPTAVPGVDEPLIVKNISVKDSAGLTRSGDLELLINDAYAEESRQSGDSPPVYPDNPSDNFLTLELDLDGPPNCIEWVAQNARMVYGNEEFKAVMLGIKVENGRLAGWHIIFAVPKDSELSRHALILPDGQSIELASFFE